MQNIYFHYLGESRVVCKSYTVALVSQRRLYIYLPGEAAEDGKAGSDIGWKSSGRVGDGWEGHHVLV